MICGLLLQGCGRSTYMKDRMSSGWMDSYIILDYNSSERLIYNSLFLYKPDPNVGNSVKRSEYFSYNFSFLLKPDPNVGNSVKRSEYFILDE